MTVKEAKGKLEGVYDYVIPKSREKRCFFEKAIGIAIKSMEKQIPKKPKDNGMRSGIFETHKYYTCPRCGNACLKKMMNERQNTSYCWDCGQAIYWEEGEINAGS